ncbi:hypothetical protein IMCC9480_768 [Oxalobacteraceae bacterium IMCC9480]|nr:hypothetical protein IMCC9480_768 [Oxalobacteraceae bacterium IMCC9480]
MVATSQVLDAVERIALGIATAGTAVAQVNRYAQDRAFVAGGIVAGAAEQPVGTFTADQPVVALTAVQGVVAGLAIQAVVPDQPVDVVIAGTGADLVAQAEGREHHAGATGGIAVEHVGRTVDVAHDGWQHQHTADVLAVHLATDGNAQVKGGGCERDAVGGHRVLDHDGQFAGSFSGRAGRQVNDPGGAGTGRAGDDPVGRQAGNCHALQGDG